MHGLVVQMEGYPSTLLGRDCRSQGFNGDLKLRTSLLEVSLVVPGRHFRATPATRLPTCSFVPGQGRFQRFIVGFQTAKASVRSQGGSRAGLSFTTCRDFDTGPTQMTVGGWRWLPTVSHSLVGPQIAAEGNFCNAADVGWCYAGTSSSMERENPP